MATRYGTGTGVPVVAVAAIHRDEAGGVLPAIVAAASPVPSGVDLWVIVTANPDGVWARSRTNAHGVDLNRNFDDGTWFAQGPGSERWSGPSAASEPETVALQAFLAQVQARLVVWWHQLGNHVDDNAGVSDRTLLETYAALARMKVRATACGNVCAGTATRYVHRVSPGSSSFVVELPRRVEVALARRHADALLAVAALAASV